MESHESAGRIEHISLVFSVKSSKGSLAQSPGGTRAHEDSSVCLCGEARVNTQSSLSPSPVAGAPGSLFSSKAYLPKTLRPN